MDILACYCPVRNVLIYTACTKDGKVTIKFAEKYSTHTHTHTHTLWPLDIFSSLQFCLLFRMGEKLGH